MFVDERTITIGGGRGGDGVVRWRREKFVAKGGPDGGNGGDGGNAYVESVRDIRALERYTEHSLHSAQDGSPGSGSLKSGRNGDDLVIFVPVGALVTNTVTLEEFEFSEEGKRVLVAAGGRGGLGNAHFKSSANTTPKKATRGQDAQSYRFHINLSLIADIGIIGLPNAGKSTLLNTLTNTTAKTAAYPFTTLEPNLGMFHGYVLADIPGILKHASEGKGLGHSFLKHIAKTRMLVHLVSSENDDCAASYRIVRDELAAFDPNLTGKRELVVLSKTDTVAPERVPDMLSELPEGSVPLTVLDNDSVAELSAKISRLLRASDA